MASVAPRTNTISSRLSRIHKTPHRFPRRIVRLGSAHAQRVYAAMDVGVIVLIVVRNGVNHSARFLRGGCVIQINQRLAVNLLGKNREIAADFSKIEPDRARRCNLAGSCFADHLLG